MGAVVSLPTAAPKRVRQAPHHARRRFIKAGQASGDVARFPLIWRPPASRQLEAERERNRALYEAGGLVRSAPFLLIAATLSTMPPEQFAALVLQLERLALVCDDDATRAALTFARQCGPIPSTAKEA